jgi:hypothetical protein
MCHVYKWFGVLFFVIVIAFMVGNLIGAACRG